jgi:undecaprenyl-diphosphatase
MYFDWQALILGFIQGIAEWLPISSSGHLVLFNKILDYNADLAFGVALHFGTLMAVFVYFGKDIVDMMEALLKGRWKTKEAKLAFLLIVSSIPAAIIGFLFKFYFETAFESLFLTAIGFAITSVILMIGSLDYKKNKKNIPSYLDSLLIGFSQALAIFPGISRSGSTMASGLVLGLDEPSALRFSFLMSIPVIFGASLVEIGSAKIPASLVLPTFAAFISGIITIHLLLKVVLTSKKSLRWFALYTFLLSAGILIYLIFTNLI